MSASTVTSAAAMTANEAAQGSAVASLPLAPAPSHMHQSRRDAGRQVCVEFAVATASAVHHMRLLARALLLLLLHSSSPSASSSSSSALLPFCNACRPLFPHLIHRPAGPRVHGVWWFAEMEYASRAKFATALHGALCAPPQPPSSASHGAVREGTTTHGNNNNHHYYYGSSTGYYIVCSTSTAAAEVLQASTTSMSRCLRVRVGPARDTPTTTSHSTSAHATRHGTDDDDDGDRCTVRPVQGMSHAGLAASSLTSMHGCEGSTSTTVCKDNVANDDDAAHTYTLCLPLLTEATSLYGYTAPSAMCVDQLVQQLGEIWQAVHVIQRQYADADTEAEERKSSKEEEGQASTITRTVAAAADDDEHSASELADARLREAVVASMQCERRLYATPSHRAAPRLPLYASIQLDNNTITSSSNEEEGERGCMRQIQTLVPPQWLQDMRVQRAFHVTTQFFGGHGKAHAPHSAAMEQRIVQLVALAGRRIELTLLCVVGNAKTVAIVVRNGGHAIPTTITTTAGSALTQEERGEGGKAAEEDDGETSRHEHEEEKEDMSTAEAEREHTSTTGDDASAPLAMPEEFPCANAVAHITVATAEGVAPVYSNVLCAPEYDPRKEGRRHVRQLPRHTVVTGVFAF